MYNGECCVMTATSVPWYLPLKEVCNTLPMYYGERCVMTATSVPWYLPLKEICNTLPMYNGERCVMTATSVPWYLPLKKVCNTLSMYNGELCVMTATPVSWYPPLKEIVICCQCTMGNAALNKIKPSEPWTAIERGSQLLVSTCNVSGRRMRHDCHVCAMIPAKCCWCCWNEVTASYEPFQCKWDNHQFSASAVELEFLRSERRLRSGRLFA